jgi:UDP-glucose-4-epimerase GalE
MPIREDAEQRPVNPYGRTKLIAEMALSDFAAAYGLKSISLRYFNACGSEPGTSLGEQHDPETHLIPLLLRAIKTGQPVTIFGQDYETPDGTCIRDYVHVSDLARAHVLALRALLDGGATGVFNVGTGTGHSVLEVVRAVEEVTGKTVPRKIGPRREGDAAVLVADSSKLKRALVWKPHYTSLHEIVQTAWQFERLK